MKLKYMTLALTCMLSSSLASAIPTGLQWPIPGKTVADTSFFFGVDDSVGADLRKCNGRFYTHLGTDIMAAPGTQVYPVYPGKVERIGNDASWGGYMLLSHDNDKWTSVYWHLDTNPKVSLHQTVDTNTIIGTVHDTSNMGDVSHLHLAIRNISTFLGSPPNSYTGYYGCDNVGKENFVQPYDYLLKASYYVADDAEGFFTYQGNWAVSTATEFYYGSGYHVTNSPGAYVEFSRPFSVPHNYNVYTRVPIDTNRTTQAQYDLYVNGSYKTTTYVNQTNTPKGANTPLFFVSVRAGDTVKVKVSNPSGKGYLVVDNLLFVDQ